MNVCSKVIKDVHV